MTFNPIIIKLLSERCGCDVTTAAGATVLAHDIEAKTGEKLSANTLKRLVGIIPYDYLPRRYTLDILAKYLGYSSWKIMSESINDTISDFDSENPFIEIVGLKPGTEISFKWEPDREIRLRHLGEGRCEVVAVANSKLMKEDILTLSQLAEGYPLVAKDVMRQGKSLGCYTTAKITGIQDLTIS